MTPNQFRAALRTLGLTYHTAAEELRMGKWGYQTVGKWARGEQPIPGPVQVAVELMLERREFVAIERLR
jgi:hypothetical protein